MLEWYWIVLAVTLQISTFVGLCYLYQQQNATQQRERTRKLRHWYSENLTRIYGPNYSNLSPKQMKLFSDGTTFEKISGIFQVHYQSGRAQQEGIRPLYRQVRRNRRLNCQEVNRLNSKLGNILNFRSNSIGGSSLSFEDTEAIIVQGQCPAHYKPLQEILSVINHHAAWRKTLPLVQRGRCDISLQFIRELHALVTRSETDANPGRFRTQSSQLVQPTHTKSLVAHPIEVKALMRKLLSWLYTTEDHPVDVVINFYQRFTRIQPFLDGNGRTCRLLCSLIAMQAGYGPLLFRKTTTESYWKAIRSWEKGNSIPFGDIVWVEMEDVLQLYDRCFAKEYFR